MKGAVPAAALLCGLAGPAFAIDYWKPDTNSCNQMSTTRAIVDCLDTHTKFWDGRLNQAWKALNTMLDDPSTKGQLALLKPAQRLWLQYRAANCAFYDAAPGSIRQIAAAECMRRMTQDRAIELQAAGPQN